MRAFRCCTALRRVALPQTLSKIGRSAFSCCESLTGIIIPRGVLEIGYAAFSNCISLGEVTIPGSVKVIYTNAFDECSGNLKIIVEDDNDGNLSNYFALAFSELEVIQKAASKPVESLDAAALTYLQSLFGVFMVPSGVETTSKENNWFKCNTRPTIRSYELRFK